MNKFVGLGAQRAGTTWLWRVLQSHPEVAFSPVKELHYFSVKHAVEQLGPHKEQVREQLTHHVARYEPKGANARATLRLRMMAHWFSMNDDEDYAEYFERIAEYTGKSCVGEITPLYALLAAEGFADIAKVLSGVRLFYVMRSPFERVWSNARMRGVPPNDLLQFARQPAVQGRTDYRGTLERLLTAVPKEQVHVAFYEELCDREQGPKHLGELFQHLGISPFKVPAEINQDREGAGAPTTAEPTMRRKVIEHLRPTYDFAREFMGRLPPNWERDLAGG